MSSAASRPMVFLKASTSRRRSSSDQPSSSCIRRDTASAAQRPRSGRNPRKLRRNMKSSSLRQRSSRTAWTTCAPMSGYRGDSGWSSEDSLSRQFPHLVGTPSVDCREMIGRRRPSASARQRLPRGDGTGTDTELAADPVRHLLGDGAIAGDFAADDGHEAGRPFDDAMHPGRPRLGSGAAHQGPYARARPVATYGAGLRQIIGGRIEQIADLVRVGAHRCRIVDVVGVGRADPAAPSTTSRRTRAGRAETAAATRAASAARTRDGCPLSSSPATPRTASAVTRPHRTTARMC